MAAGVDGREGIGRSLAPAAREVTSLPGWAQVAAAVVVAVALGVLARVAGVPGHWAPLVIGGALGIMTAVVAGAPPRDPGR
jgi:hypothetical protein